MDDERHWFEKFTLYMERNIKGVQVGNVLYHGPKEVLTELNLTFWEQQYA
jgi:hypothetical protein